MSDSTHLNLPFIAAAQAQKHVTHNEALTVLDALVQLMVLDRDRASPPASPAEGDRHIIAGAAVDDWAGKDGHIAVWQGGGWVYYPPNAGWLAWVAAENTLVAWTGSEWSGSLLGVLQNMSLLGVNATADATNRLSIAAEAVLFNNDGNGIQAKLNKNASSDTASVLFQTGWSGRAEFGTSGDDDWHVKVSPDGSIWHEALIADRSNGAVRLPAGKLGIGADPGTNTLMVGGTTSLQEASGVVRQTVRSTDSTAISLLAAHADGVWSSSYYNFNRSRGSYSSESAVASPDVLGAVDFYGYDGSDYRLGSRIICRVSGTVSGGVVPAKLGFFTTPPGGAQAERLTLLEGGNVGIGVSAPQTKLHVDGPIRCKSYTVGTAPSASAAGAGAQIYVSDETGGGVPAFSDGSNWRRVTDRAVIS